MADRTIGNNGNNCGIDAREKLKAMNKFEKSVMALLAAIAIEGAVTAWEIQPIARNGFEIELDDKDIQEIENAAAAAFEDINEEITE